MSKESKTLQKNWSNLRLAKIFWFPILYQSLRDALASWLWIFILPLVADVIAAILFLIKNGWMKLMLQMGEFFSYYCFGVIAVLFLIFIYRAITSSATKYFEQEQKAELYTRLCKVFSVNLKIKCIL